MPKILESIREQILLTAKNQLRSNGYAKTTIRSVAAECGIAVGTVYNYFPSKDMLIATFMSEDWHVCIGPIAAHADEDARTRLMRIYDALLAFSDRYRPLFADADAEKTYQQAFRKQHKMLREQLAALIEPRCGDVPDRAFLAEFIAEALLTWTMEGKPFEQIYQILQKLTEQEREGKPNEQL